MNAPATHFLRHGVRLIIAVRASSSCPQLCLPLRALTAAVWVQRVEVFIGLSRLLFLSVSGEYRRSLSRAFGGLALLSFPEGRPQLLSAAVIVQQQTLF